MQGGNDDACRDRRKGAGGSLRVQLDVHTVPLFPREAAEDHEAFTNDPFKAGRIDKVVRVFLVGKQSKRSFPCPAQDVERLPKREVCLHQDRLVQINEHPEAPQALIFFHPIVLVHAKLMIQLRAVLFNRLAVP